MSKHFPMAFHSMYKLQSVTQAFSLGDERWLLIAEKKSYFSKFDKYREVHNGALPVFSLFEKLSIMFRHGRLMRDYMRHVRDQEELKENGEQLASSTRRRSSTTENAVPSADHVEPTAAASRTSAMPTVSPASTTKKSALTMPQLQEKPSEEERKGSADEELETMKL